jgi:hypothetical protein
VLKTLRIFATTSCDVGPLGLSTKTMDSTPGYTGRAIAISFDKNFIFHSQP